MIKKKHHLNFFTDRPVHRCTLGCLYSGGTLPLSGSTGSHHVCCLAFPSPMSPRVYSLHKSIFVIAGFMEQTDTVLHWSSCSPSSVYHQLSICFSLCLFLFPLSFLSFPPSICFYLNVLLLFSLVFCSCFVLQKEERAFRAQTLATDYVKRGGC